MAGRTAMAGRDSIDGPPTVLFSLQAPLDKTNGRIFASPVYSLSGSRKRKRAEISTTVDGEGINIHDVRSSQFITSYPVPPRSYFQSASCSFCTKSTASRSATRHTYAATSSVPITSETSQGPLLLHFAEPLKQNDSAPPIQHKHALSPEAGRVFHLDILPHVGSASNETAEHDVLAITRSGDLLCLDETLERTLWQKQVKDIGGQPEDNDGSSFLEFCELVDVSHARRGILKGREDVIAKLGQEAGEATERPTDLLILVIVILMGRTSCDGRSRQLQLFSVRQRSAHGLTSSAPPVRHLLSYDLTRADHDSRVDLDTAATYNLDVTSGLMHQLRGGIITTFDLTGLLPRAVSILSQDKSPIESFLRLSPSRLLTATNYSCSVHDTRYDTVQASQQFELFENLDTASKKRKRVSDVATGPMQMSFFLPSAGLVVGLRGNAVLGLKLQGRYASAKWGSNGGTLLIDALGRGTRSKSSRFEAIPRRKVPSFLSNNGQEDGPDLAAWEETKAGLEQAFADHSIQLFDHLFAAAVGITLPISATTSTGAVKTTKVNGINHQQVNGTHELNSGAGSNDEEEATASSIQYTWPSDQILAAQPQRFRDQAIYALGRMFERSKSATKDARGENAGSLEIKFFPPNVYRWLVVNSFLTTEVLSQALLRFEPVGSVLRTTPWPAIAAALLGADPSTQALFTLITESSYLDINLLIRAIDIYVRSHTDHPTVQSGPKNLPAPPSVQNGDSVDFDMQNGEESDLEALIKHADEAISKAESILDDTFELRTIGLKHALIKLFAFPRAQVTQALRHELSVHDIRFLIQILRIELQDGGWVSRYLDAGPANLQVITEKNEDGQGDYYGRSPSDNAITLVSSLLTCCVDAIGIGGWLSSSSSPDGYSPSLSGASEDLEPHELIKVMHNETFAVLEGLHEVNFIGNTVNEFLRYAERVRSALPPPNVKQRNKKARRDGQMTKPYTVHAGNEGWEDITTRMGAALPVGGKIPEAEKRLDATRVGSGGVIRTKSKRELGMELSKKVGRYSFEKIRV